MPCSFSIASKQASHFQKRFGSSKRNSFGYHGEAKQAKAKKWKPKTLNINMHSGCIN